MAGRGDGSTRWCASERLTKLGKITAQVYPYSRRSNNTNSASVSPTLLTTTCAPSTPSK